MRKKLLITGLLVLTAFGSWACGAKQTDTKEDTTQFQEADAKPEEKDTAEENSDMEINENTQNEEGKKVLIYYGNDNADAIIYKEVTISELSPETLIDELAKVNIVSMDTKVNSVSLDEKDKKLLHLDMSKEFGEYVSMMGTAGEYIVMGGLVDTFLDAYDCEHVKITVEGETLETGHAIYEGNLQFYETYRADE